MDAVVASQDVTLERGEVAKRLAAMPAAHHGVGVPRVRVALHDLVPSHALADGEGQVDGDAQHVCQSVNVVSQLRGNGDGHTVENADHHLHVLLRDVGEHYRKLEDESD